MLSRSIHDINNPFSVIIGQLSIAEILLSREELNLEKVKSSLQKMKSGTEKMQERIDGLRVYYKVAMGESNYSNWESLEKAVRYINMAFEENDLELNFPAGDFESKFLQDLFILMYYALKKHQSADTKTIISAEVLNSKLQITTQGNINSLQDLNQSVFKSSFDRLMAKLEANEKGLSIEFPF
ncbi:MAG: hypothetical protein CME65_13615 [Halobacteriovoraceae bacterium]|nr:hypothetical protein [Halobacteriovoraceae bacterium]